ncbi:zinc metalloprotease, partial [Coemansia sp. RSA 1365]
MSGTEASPAHSPKKVTKGESSKRSKKFGDDPNSAIDAQALVVMQKGFLDDVIDGIQLGLITIAVICIIFIAVFGSSLPNIFPVTAPFYNMVMRFPGAIMNLPQCAAELRQLIPTNLDELMQLGAAIVEHFQEALHTLPYKECVLVFSWATYVWEAKLNVRQRDRLHEVKRPQAIASFISRQIYLEANSYGLDKSSLALVKDFVNQLQTTFIIVYDLIPMLWYAVGECAEQYLGLGEEYQITHSVLFFVAAVLISTVLSLPFELYATFVVERKHGFNKQTWGLFFSDSAKSLLLSMVFGVPILAAFLWVIGKTGSQFYLYAWVLLAVVQFLGILIYPTFIQPLFNKFEPLPAGELREAIESLASRLEFPLKKLYVVDGSKRSGHSNAYVIGFFKSKRIVIYDTLIEQCSTEEIVAVLGHELGHWKKNHVMRMLAMAQLQTFLVFFAFSCFIGEQTMYSSFGMHTTPIIIGFILFQYLYEPLGSLLHFGNNLVSRVHEFQADEFSKKLGYGKQLAS